MNIAYRTGFVQSIFSQVGGGVGRDGDALIVLMSARGHTDLTVTLDRSVIHYSHSVINRHLVGLVGTTATC